MFFFHQTKAVQKERGPSKSKELKKEFKQNFTVAHEIRKKKDLKLINFRLKEEITKAHVELNETLPLTELKNYPTGKSLIFLINFNFGSKVH